MRDVLPRAKSCVHVHTILTHVFSPRVPCLERKNNRGARRGTCVLLLVAHVHVARPRRPDTRHQTRADVVRDVQYCTGLVTDS